jgi:hypothetical protein
METKKLSCREEQKVQRLQRTGRVFLHQEDSSHQESDFQRFLRNLLKCPRGRDDQFHSTDLEKPVRL